MASNNQFLRHRAKTPKIAINKHDYNSLCRLADRVNSMMTGNPNFPTSTPSLTDVQAANVAVRALITPKAQRRSFAQQQALNDACETLFTLLTAINKYVVNASAGDELTYLSSGFRFENVYSKSAKSIQAPTFVKQVNTPSVPFENGIFKFRKPQGLIKGARAIGYNVYHYDFATSTRGSLIGSTTKTGFDLNGEVNSGDWLQLVAISRKGEGRSVAIRVA